MEVSVVIPVFNADQYVEKAVESAFEQTETAEVILVEDGSSDNSLKVCRSIAERDCRVKVHLHPNGDNRGAGASRNLGLMKAKCSYVAFLDADDYYLSGRFKVARRVFREHPDADGVYGAIGTFFEDDASSLKWNRHGGREITTLRTRIPPEQLFRVLVDGNSGNFSIDALVVKSSIFSKCGLFPENLRLHQDTAMIIQMASSSRLYPGSLKSPVAVRRVHSNNRSISPFNRDLSSLHLWKTLFNWSVRRGCSGTQKKLLFRNYIYFAVKNIFRHSHSGTQKLSLLAGCFCSCLTHPYLFLAVMAGYMNKYIMNPGNGDPED